MGHLPVHAVLSGSPAVPPAEEVFVVLGAVLSRKNRKNKSFYGEGNSSLWGHKQGKDKIGS